MARSFVLLLLLPLLALRCADKRNDPKPTPPETLPPATQEGKDTFGCLVNGKVWLPAVPFTYPLFAAPAKKTTLWVGNGYFFLWARRQNDKESSSIKFDFCHGDFHGVGTYILSSPPQTCGSTSFDNYVANATYYVDPLPDNVLTINVYDTTRRIIAGRFQFTGVAAPGDTVRVADGRFDLKF